MNGSPDLVVDPRKEARQRVKGHFDVRVLEPAPPAVVTPPWFADDPLAPAEPPTGLPVLAPVPGGDITWDALTRDEPDLAEWCSFRWLGAWHRLPTPENADVLARTRLAWHALAEHVLSAARFRASGKIGLRFTRGGFGTPFYGADEQVRAVGTDLVVIRDGILIAERVTTLRAAAALAGIVPGAPDVYEPTTNLDLDAPLDVDADAARLLADWFGFACSTLEQLRAETESVDQPSRVQIWPEHLDIAVEIGDDARGSRGTFGASPGDAEHPEPYLYVTHRGSPTPEPFWNDDCFGGASLGLAALAEVEDQRAGALEFYRRGRAVLSGTPE